MLITRHGKSLLAAGLMAASAVAAVAAGSWTSTGRMAIRRYAPTATTLSTGKVLVAGGYDGLHCTPTAELYDPVSDTFLPTGPMQIGRNFASAVTLDSGRVVIIGGFHEVAGSLSDALIFEPLANAFRPTLGTMYSRRELFTATKLPNGEVLVAGGFRTGIGLGTLREAEIFEPVFETFRRTGSMQTPYGRFGHDAVYLPTVNKVLIVGGKERRSNTDWRSLNSAELFDPATGKFTLTKSMAYRRDRPTVAWVPSAGKALVIGGMSEAPGTTRSDVLRTEWFNPATNSFAAGPSLAVGRMAHTLTVLSDGSLMVAGGWNISLNRTTETAERFFPSTGAFVTAGSMADGRHDHGAALLADGTVLVAGGKEVDQNPGGRHEYLKDAEVYTP